MGPEIANFRAIIGLLWPTVFLAKMSILNTVVWLVRMVDGFKKTSPRRQKKAKFFYVVHTYCEVASNLASVKKTD